MKNYVMIGKIEAAKRHLSAAITMFFERKDSIVVYTTAWASYQILSDVCKQRGIHRAFEDNPVFREYGVEKEVLKEFRAPRNFFHHADKDPDKEIKFFPDLAFLLPILAFELLEKIEGKEFFPGRLLQIWFYLKYPKRMPKSVSENLSKAPPLSSEDYDFFLEALGNKNNSPVRGF